MDVVVLHPDLEERDLGAIADVEADAPQHLVHLIGDDRTPVLGRADQVVEKRGDIMAAVTLWLL